MTARAFLARIASTFRREKLDAGVAEEIAEHLRLTEMEYRKRGLSLEQARFAARREFGNPTIAREASREQWGFGGLDDWIADLRFGSRVLRRHWAATGVAIGALALGVGAMTAVLSTLDLVEHHRYPYREPDRLAYLWAKSVRQPSYTEMQVSAPELLDWQAASRQWKIAGFSWTQNVNVTVNGSTERVSGARVTANLFEVLGCSPAFGRSFLPSDEADGGAKVAVATDAFWRERFGPGKPELPRTIMVDRNAYSIVGVMTSDFAMPILQHAQLLLPLRDVPWLNDRSSRSLVGIGRVREGATLAGATAELTTLSARFNAASPADTGRWGLNVVPIARESVAGAERTLTILLALSVLVLLIACANVAILLLARIPAREQELSIRVALGAGRRRLLRQLLAESALLATGGCAIGLMAARPAMSVLIALVGPWMAFGVSAALNTTSVLLAFTIAALTCLLFGLAPAVHALRDRAGGGNLIGSRTTGGRDRGRLRAAILATEVGLSIVLAVAGWLMIESVIDVERRPLGFDTGHLITARVSLDSASYPDLTSQQTFFGTLADRLRAHREVSDLTIASSLPLSTSGDMSSYVTPMSSSEHRDTSAMYVRVAMPDFFAAMHEPLVDGTTFDDHGREPTVIVNESAARQLWPDQRAVGQLLTVLAPAFNDGLAVTPGVRRVVAVARDTRSSPLFTQKGFPTLFFPASQNPVRAMYVAVRSSAPGSAAAIIRREVQSLDRMVPVYSIKSMQELLDSYLAPVRLDAAIVDTLAAIGLLLTLVGVYSVVALFVSQRTREIGIRIAVGARAQDVAGLVARGTLRPALVGSALGIAAAVGGTRLVSSLLYGVSPLQPRAFVAAAIALCVAVLLGALVPAIRAARTDPVVAIRTE